MCIAALYKSITRGCEYKRLLCVGGGVIYVYTIIIINIKLCVCGAMVGTKEEDCMRKNPRG